MKNKLSLLFGFIFIFVASSPAYASNMGFKKVFIDSNSSGGFVLEDVDNETEQILNKNVLALNKITDLIIKSSDLFDHSNKGRNITFQNHMAQMNMQFLALQSAEGYFIGSTDKTNNNTFESIQIINNSFNHVLIADLNSDFTGLLIADVNGDAADAKIIFGQDANGIAQVGLGVVGATGDFARTVTYTYDALGNATQSYDVAAFNNLTLNIRDSKGDAFSGINVNPFGT